jgi:hypothetical protein
MEIWKDIDGYEGYYQVSSYGRTRSLDRTIRNRLYKGVVKKHRKDKNGYCIVNLWGNSKNKSCKAHRLVAIHFITNIGNKPQVNHKDGNKDNNHVDNLEWCDCHENMIHAFKNGLSSNRGEKSSQSRLSNEQVLEIRKMHDSGKCSKKEIGKKFGYSVGGINGIVSRRTWSHL